MGGFWREQMEGGNDVIVLYSQKKWKKKFKNKNACILEYSSKKFCLKNTIIFEFIY